MLFWKYKEEIVQLNVSINNSITQTAIALHLDLESSETKNPSGLAQNEIYV